MDSRLFEKVPRYFKTVSRYNEMVSRLFEKAPRYTSVNVLESEFPRDTQISLFCPFQKHGSQQTDKSPLK